MMKIDELRFLELQRKLYTMSKKELARDQEDFEPSDWYGGNMDDAYWAGAMEGQTSMARSLLAEFKDLFHEGDNE